jgi:Ca2+-binding EF-hand superfamily protein
MDDALMHPWVIGASATRNAINLDTLRSLRQFQHQSKLKKAVAGILAQNMGEGPEKRVREHFDRLDIDGDKQLDLGELKRLIKDLGFHDVESEQEAERMLQEADEDNNGQISFEEFATVWQRKLLSVNDQYIRAVFGVLDSNGDGFIDKEELRGVLEDFSEQQIEEMLYEIDSQGNGDGKIDFTEFKSAMKEQIEKREFKPSAEKFSAKDLTNETVGDEEN